MGLLERIRQQTAVYWEYEGPDGAGGGIYSSPVEIECRWEDKQELFRDNETGEQVLSNAIVYPDRDLVVGGYLLLGSLDDLGSDSASDNVPVSEEDSRRIQGWEKIPNLTATKYLRKALLV